MGIAEAILRVRDQASGPLSDIADNARDAANALDDAGNQASDASGKFARAGDAFGSVGGAAGKLAGGLDLLVPGLGSVAQAIADFADIGEVGAAAAEGMSGSLGILAGVAGTAAAAAAVLAAAYAVVGNATSDQATLTYEAAAAYVAADTAAAQLAGTVDALAAAQQTSAAAFAAATQQIELLTGATTAYEAAAARAGQQVRDGARAELDVLRERLRIQLEGLRQAETVLRSDQATAEQRAEAIRQQQSYASQVGATRLAITALKNETEQTATQLEGLVAAEGYDKEAKAAQAEAARRAGEAERARTQAAKEAADAVRAAADAELKRREAILATLEAEGQQIYGARSNPQIQFLTDFYAKLGQAREQQDFTLLLAELAAGMSAFGLTTEQATAAQEALSAAMAGMPEAPAAGPLPGATKAQSAIEAASSINGLVKLDPTGISAAVVEGLRTVADIGQGGSGVLGEIESLLADTAKGLPMIGDTVVSFVDELVSSIVPALIEGIAGLPNMIIDMMIGLVSSIISSIPDRIESALGSLGDILGGLFRAAFTALPELLFAALNILLDPQFWIDIAKAFLKGLLDMLNPFNNKQGDGLLQRDGFLGRTGAAVKDIFDGRDNGRIGQSNIFNFNGVITENLEAAARRFRDLDRRGVRR